MKKKRKNTNEPNDPFKEIVNYIGGIGLILTSEEYEKYIIMAKEVEARRCNK